MTINLLDKIKKLTSRVLQFLRIKTKKEIAETLSSHKLGEKVKVPLEDNDRVLGVICGKIGGFYIVGYCLDGTPYAKWLKYIETGSKKNNQEKILNEENNKLPTYELGTKVKTPIKYKSKEKRVIACIIGYKEKNNKYIVGYVTPNSKEIERKFRHVELTKKEVENYIQ